MIVGRFRDKSYCVLDLNTRQVNKCSEDLVRQYIQNGVMGNAHLSGKLIKGNFMSFSRLPYVEDIANKPRWIVLCACMNLDKTRDGYLVCRQDGSGFTWQPAGVIRDYTKEYANVSVYLTNQEKKEIISCKGYTFPRMRELLDKAKANEYIEKENRHIVTQQSASHIDSTPMSNQPYMMQIDMSAIKAKRKQQLDAAERSRISSAVIPDNDISVNGRHSGAYAQAYAKHSEKISQLNKSFTQDNSQVITCDFDSILREYDNRHKQ
jgi:hypothetical protein